MTAATDVLLAGFQALSEIEQAEALRQLREQRLLADARKAGERAEFLKALLTVMKVVGHIPTVADYRSAWAQLKDEGTSLPSATAVFNHFGSWRLAKEALSLSEETSAARIEARFQARRVGKVHRYRTETLQETLARCAADLGRVPLVAEFKAWRQRELELAAARGEPDFRLPSDSPYRRRYGSWEKALLQLGLPAAAIEARLEPGRLMAEANLRPYQVPGHGAAVH